MLRSLKERKRMMRSERKRMRCPTLAVHQVHALTILFSLEKCYLACDPGYVAQSYLGQDLTKNVLKI